MAVKFLIIITQIVTNTSEQTALKIALTIHIIKITQTVLN